LFCAITVGTVDNQALQGTEQRRIDKRLQILLGRIDTIVHKLDLRDLRDAP
jgi:hypothetical protein